MQRKIQTVQTLLDALPFIKEFRKQTIVIKYGGSAQTSANLKEKFAQDVLLMYLVGIKPVIVHGGGKRITEILDRLKIPTNFIEGQRVTTPEVMEIVEMVLSGDINKEIVSLLNNHGAKAIGISGKDAHFITARPKDFEKLGYTGKIENIDPEVVNRLIDEKFVPVIAPIAASDELSHPGYNINADLAASKIAVALKAKKIIFLTDTPGVLDKEKNLISTLDAESVEKLKQEGVIKGGMVPKVDACLEAINGGVEKAHIIDGRVEHSILLELFTSAGIGTQIVK
ncbi:acetylglutamate kinase [Nitrosophilus alvini]|uniref:acetylglutamate kinase n=1 Tax=Nitrosophilus alvini TaxID=2714855 RepID=UPI00190DB11C|nr:acetylglutamate kinase [Nitrosophilus alvini]